MLSVREVLNKLEPVIPEKVRAWRRGMELSSPNTKLLIERHARLQFARAFKPGTLLLRPPPPSTFRGKLSLGTTMYSKAWGPFGLSFDELLQNLVILGRSGAGKTNIANLLVTNLLKRNIPFIFFDWKRTCRDLLPAWPNKLKVFTPGRDVAPFQFNLLSPPEGLESSVWSRHFIDTVARAYTLGDGSKSLLQKAITTVGEDSSQQLNLETLLKAIQETPATGRVSGWRVSALRAMESLFLESKPIRGRAMNDSLEDLLTGFTVLELDALSTCFKKCLIPLLCLYLFFTKLHSGKREELSLVVFVEEAHHLLHRQFQNASESVMEMLIRQCREVGIALVVLDQHPHLLSPAVLGNSYCSICLNLKDPQDINRGSALSQLTTSDKNVLSKLPVGYGVVKTQDRWIAPFLVKFDLLNITKGAVKDSDIAGLSRLSKGPSPPRAWLSSQPGSLGSSRQPPFVQEDAFDLVADVLKHPIDGVDKRYKRLGWSCDKGNRIKNACIESGILEMEWVVEYGTRRILLRPSQVAMTTMGGGGRARSSESIAHSYWKWCLAGVMEGSGYEVQTEAPCSHGGRVDVLAKKDQLVLALEVETGKSNAVKNVQKCLASHFDRVVVAATSRNALATVERQLASAGLMIPNKVDLVLAANLAQELRSNSSAKTD